MFSRQISEFNKSILGLREFVDLIDPFLKERQHEVFGKVMNLISSGLYNNLLITQQDIGDEVKADIRRQKEECDVKIIEIYKEPLNVQVNVETIDNDKKAAFTLHIDKENEAVNKDLSTLNQTQNHISILYKNSLIALLSSVEWFFSQILHYYYSNYPEAAGIQKKTLTLSELKTFGSIDDAEKYLIDNKIEEILRGSFETWIALLKSDLSLKLGYLA